MLESKILNNRFRLKIAWNKKPDNSFPLHPEKEKRWTFWFPCQVPAPFYCPFSNFCRANPKESAPPVFRQASTQSPQLVHWASILLFKRLGFRSREQAFWQGHGSLLATHFSLSKITFSRKGLINPAAPRSRDCGQIQRHQSRVRSTNSTSKTAPTNQNAAERYF